MRQKTLVLAGCALLLCGPAVAEETVIQGVGLSRDFECDGQDVIVAGQGNTIALEGACGHVKVMGADHRLTLTSAKSLMIEGASATVTGGTVETLAVDLMGNAVTATVASKDGPAEVRIFGADQKAELTFASAASVTVGGSANTLSWTAADGVKAPKVSASGVGHTIKRKT